LLPQLKQGDADFTKVSTDTRSLEAGELFIALRGERYDAHDFLQEAADKKPCAMVVEKFNPDIALPQLIVADTTLALGQLAALNRSLFIGPLVAITGSSGKTTVKTLVADILSECGETLATKGNLNNHIGVPLTLLQLEARHQFAVIEMGASGPHEIAYACSLAKPQVAMINNVMPAHIQGFGSVAGVAQAKAEIYTGLVAGGIAIVNIDDEFSAQWLETLKGRKIIRVSLLNSESNCHAESIQLGSDDVEFTLNINQQRIHVVLNAQGEHSVRNALMAAACSYALGASLEQIRHGFTKFSPVAGRMSRHRGVNQALVIDDSYNANPGSVRAAIDVLAQAQDSVLVLGDLGELGEHAAELHAELGAYAREKNINFFYSFGVLSENACHRFGEGAIHYTDRNLLVKALKKQATATTTFLIKGSRSSKMDLVVRQLCDFSGDSH
jgi:UDP-N-acetylmuramoyl-tripeptide--D-alanyl-D-alanine ligase